QKTVLIKRVAAHYLRNFDGGKTALGPVAEVPFAGGAPRGVTRDEFAAELLRGLFQLRDFRRLPPGESRQLLPARRRFRVAQTIELGPQLVLQGDFGRAVLTEPGPKLGAERLRPEPRAERWMKK